MTRVLPQNYPLDQAKLRDMARQANVPERLNEPTYSTGIYVRWNVDADEPIFSVNGTYLGTYGDAYGGNPLGNYLEIMYQLIPGSNRGTYRLAAFTTEKVILSRDVPRADWKGKGFPRLLRRAMTSFRITKLDTGEHA